MIGGVTLLVTKYPLDQFSEGKPSKKRWRRVSESNRRWGFCRALPYHLANPPSLKLRRASPPFGTLATYSFLPYSGASDKPLSEPVRVHSEAGGKEGFQPSREPTNCGSALGRWEAEEQEQKNPLASFLARANFHLIAQASRLCTSRKNKSPNDWASPANSWDLPE